VDIFRCAPIVLPGVLGAIERFFITRTLRAMCGQELSLLEVAAMPTPVADMAR
jgi:hypothetical protein